MRLKGMQFHGQVPEVPHGHCLVSRACRKDILAKRVEGQTVDLGCVGVDNVLGFRGIAATSVPAASDKR